MRNRKQLLGVVSILICAAFLFGACGTKYVNKGMVPKWYLNPPDSKDEIYGTGASPKMQSIQLASTTADANARNALAQTVQVSIQGMVRTFLQQSGTMDNTRTLQFSESVGKQVVDVSLVGSKIDKREIKDGRCYSLAVISMDSVRNSLLSAVRDAAAQMAEEKAKDAFKDLEKEINAGKEIPIINQ